MLLLFLQHTRGAAAMKEAPIGAAHAEQKKRRDTALDSSNTTILSIFWITPQFLIFGLSEMLTAVGLIEFFYKQSLRGMQAFLTAITYTYYSYSVGFYLSSLLVSFGKMVYISSLLPLNSAPKARHQTYKPLPLL
ncbi:hypothetical protein Tsubulata_001505 [Turnera subulata]|uniref:Uncharacterized protein n=1 Tax=Turnera subulata TaxID=218843 RepID=A0A9Q0IZY1_9ROSI|nr:hypothetical protein Tsubulata_001505 [Turnera subulata]